MLVRLYAFMWILLAMATVSFYFIGYLIEQVVTVVGFVSATLVVMGMSILLPLSVGQRPAVMTRQYRENFQEDHIWI